ncbi:MAG: fumarate hydratase, partial [Clostridiales bacterium]|nr:fumarate hydratase [Clostridiales bacterium]
AYLAKLALLRPLAHRHPDPYYAELEIEMLRQINELGLGPMGLGGRSTALGVAIETLPTHIAGLPVAVNISCHATRHLEEVL